MALISKSQQLARHLRGAIQSGRWSPGERLPGEFDLQSQYGISRTTIRDALNTLASEGLVERKHGAGTFAVEPQTVGCVAIAADAERMTSPLGYWYRALVEEAQQRIASSGFRATLAVGHGKTPEEFVASMNILNGPNTADLLGVIDTTSVPLLGEMLASEGVSSVMIECAIPAGSYGVVLDYAKLTRLAVEKLELFGHSDFALMCYKYDAKSLVNLNDPVHMEFARLSHSAVGMSTDRLVQVSMPPSAGYAYKAFLEWWQKPNKPSAMYFYDDSLFDAASRAIAELGIRVPDDLAILTHANLGRRFHFPVRLSRIGFDPSMVMGTAWGILEKLIRNEPLFEAVVKVDPYFDLGESLDSRVHEAAISEPSSLSSVGGDVQPGIVG